MRALPFNIFAIDSRPFGLTYADWSARWWQWLLSIPRSQSPAFDSTGINSTINQDDPNVFFLCQTIDGIEAMDKSIRTRKIAIKSGKSILIPIINWVSVLHVDGETDEELMAVAKTKMDAITKLEIIIDQVTIKDGLEQYRARSQFFDIVLPENNILDLPRGHRRFISDGYWIFLKPLFNDIKLATLGSCSSGLNKFGVNYEIDVE